MHLAYDTLGVVLSIPSLGPIYVTISRTREDASSSQCCLCILEHREINCTALYHGRDRTVVVLRLSTINIALTGRNDPA